MTTRVSAPPRRALLLALSLGIFSVACESSTKVEDHADKVEESLSYFRDIKPIIDEKCTQCHVTGGIGPLPFTSYDELEPHLKLIRADIESDIMPPWRAKGPRDQFIGDRRLSSEQKRKVLSWIDQGAPLGDASEEPAHEPAVSRGLARVDRTLQVSEPYAPTHDPDTYRCFVLEWPETTTKFITGLGVLPERTAMVHHAIVYLISPENVERVRKLDAEAEGPGYDCFGSTGVGSWLTSYEPGGYPQDVPGGLGLQIKPGSLLVLQVHYNTLNETGADQSSVQLAFEDEVDRIGRTSLFMNPSWLTGQMPIPANQSDVVHRYQGVPFDLLLNPGEHDIYAVDLHMHTLASSGSIGIVRAADQSQEILLDIPSWAFEWQETYRFKQPVRLHAGDQLWVECHYDNTADKQLVVAGKRLMPRDVNWGEGTTDEMCLGNVLLTKVE